MIPGSFWSKSDVFATSTPYIHRLEMSCSIAVASVENPAGKVTSLLWSLLWIPHWRCRISAWIEIPRRLRLCRRKMKNRNLWMSLMVRKIGYVCHCFLLKIESTFGHSHPIQICFESFMAWSMFFFVQTCMWVKWPVHMTIYACQHSLQFLPSHRCFFLHEKDHILKWLSQEGIFETTVQCGRRHNKNSINRNLYSGTSRVQRRFII